VLLRALAERYPDLEHHIDGVTHLAEAVALELGVSDDDAAFISQAAELHDVGKVAIPDTILHKPGPLDEAEWEFMRSHTIIGERIIAAAPALAQVARLVRSSHERWDGAGYPDQLAGEDIPLGSRIISVCDAFDAMVTERPYSAARAFEEALAELDRCAGTQFDPAVVTAFVEQARRPTMPFVVASAA
jgi:HD-GYP domain-containing protein (c-di-GMP phosphodiesterase class II)